MKERCDEMSAKEHVLKVKCDELAVSLAIKEEELDQFSIEKDQVTALVFFRVFFTIPGNYSLASSALQQSNPLFSKLISN